MSVKNAFISSKKLDHLFVVGSPLLAFAIIALVCDPRAKSGYFLQDPRTPQWFILIVALLTHSHIVLVFLRSHMNQNIFQRFKFRFTVIPVLMLASMWISGSWFAIMALFAIYWDEIHSMMQTFGFGRIYDAKLGNDPNTGRKLDIGMCFVAGLLPHMVALTYIPPEMTSDGVQEFLGFSYAFAHRFGPMLSHLRMPFIAFGIGYTVFYYLYYHKLSQQGYKYSKTKLSLFVTTGISAILIASFYTIADAAYFGNIYHAVQYYFIVYISESSWMSEKLPGKTPNRKLSLLFYCALILPFAILLAFVRSRTEQFSLFGAFWLLTSLLHFWYDGFIWSVRKGDMAQT
jgi:hypothetical protein